MRNNTGANFKATIEGHTMGTTRQYHAIRRRRASQRACNAMSMQMSSVLICLMPLPLVLMAPPLFLPDDSLRLNFSQNEEMTSIFAFLGATPWSFLTKQCLPILHFAALAASSMSKHLSWASFSLDFEFQEIACYSNRIASKHELISSRQYWSRHKALMPSRIH